MSNNTPILVTGAAGNVGSVGRGVVKLLREHDLPVRALVHRLDERSQVLSEMGAELVVADLTNGADVVRALRGCKRMYFGMVSCHHIFKLRLLQQPQQKKSPTSRFS
jgi:NAD(P)H dehydrogenase (quinone)